MADKRGPRDVCPACMEHRRQEPTPHGDQYERMYRCSGCGHVHRYCEMRFHDLAEREEARARALAKKREYEAAHREQKRRAEKIRYINNGFVLRRKLRKRYATDPDYRKERIEYAKRYAEGHREKRREQGRAYYRRHREEILFKQNRRKLEKMREGKRCGSAT